MEVRRQEGLLDESFPVLPSPMEGGGWSTIPVPVGAAADWLRALLKIESKAKDRLATHSCKATLLSMMAKYGADHSSRRLLGYHTYGKDKSLLTYSRDGLAEPLRKLEAMIRVVEQKRFVPDATRSGYFPSKDEGLPEGASLDEESDGGSDGSESRGSASDEEVEHGTEEQASAELLGKWQPEETADNHGTYARHSASRCIHTVADDGGTHFVRGRRVTSKFVILLEKPLFMRPACNGCFRV